MCRQQVARTTACTCQSTSICGSGQYSQVSLLHCCSANPTRPAAAGMPAALSLSNMDSGLALLRTPPAVPGQEL